MWNNDTITDDPSQLLPSSHPVAQGMASGQECLVEIVEEWLMQTEEFQKLA